MFILALICMYNIVMEYVYCVSMYIVWALYNSY